MKQCPVEVISPGFCFLYTKKIPEQNSVRGEHIYKKVGLLAYLT